jgi:hypothetical protein
MINKLIYKCRNEISEQANFSWAKGSIIREQDAENLFDIISENIAVLLSFNPGEKEREDWIIEKLGNVYPIDNLWQEVLREYFVEIWCMHFNSIYECRKCGCLWIQEKYGSNKFKLFYSESGNYERIFRAPGVL